jgi:hypothetical protein
MMRARMEAANSVGDLPADFPQLLHGRMSRSPGKNSVDKVLIIKWILDIVWRCLNDSSPVQKPKL